MIEAVPKPTSPQFMDVVIVQIQDILKAQLPWLDYSFGQAQKLIDKDTKKSYPAIHLGHGDYINVFPDQELGNFSFVMLHDPEKIDYKMKPFIKTSQYFSVIFWFNLYDIFAGQKDRNLEEIKQQILTVFNTKMLLSKGSIKMLEIRKEAKNIYKEFDINEVASQFLMQPYAGLRLDGTITYTDTSC